MKKISKLLRVGIMMLSLCLGTGINAQLLQYPTKSTVAFHYMVYDNYNEGQIYAAEAPFDASEKPKLFVSEDNGESYRLIFEFEDPYKEPTQPYWGRIMDLRPGKSSDIIYFQIDKSHSPYSDGVYRLNHKTGELRHYLLPNVEKPGAALGSYDVYDASGDTVIMHTTWKLEMFILMTEVYYTTDGGKNWEMIYDYVDHDFVHLARVAFSPNNPQKLFMLRSGGISGVQAGLLISEDAGKTYTEYLAGLDWGCIAFNPTNPDEIMVGSHMTSGTMTPPEYLMRSFDGGKTWQEVELEYTPFIFNYFTDIEYDPYDPNRIIVIEENQIFITDDGFKTYENLMPDNGNYFFGQNVSINPFNTDEMLIGIDGSSVKHTLDRCHSWETVGSAPHAGYGYSSVSLGGNREISPRLYFAASEEVRGIDLKKDELLFTFDSIVVKHLFADPVNGNRLFLIDTSAKELYFAVRREVSTSLYPVNTFTEKSTIVAVLPQEADQYMTAVNNKLYQINVATPDNISFTEISIPGSGDITALATTTGAIYFARGGKVYYSVDGNSWTERSTGLGTDAITALAINTVDANKMLLSAGNKLYRSTDGGTNWTVALYGYRADILAYSTDGTCVMAGAYTTTNENAYLLYSTDGGTNWDYVSSDALQHANTESMAFEFGRTDTLVAHIASMDMGRLAYIIPLTCTETEISVYPRYYEDFESGIPLCYTQESVDGSVLWKPVKASEGTPANAPAVSEIKLGFKADAAAQTRLSLPLLVDLDTLENPMLSFAYVLPEDATLNVYYRLTADGTWTELAVLPARTEWASAQILLPAELEKAYVSIVATATSATEIYLDNIKIASSKGLPCNPARDITAEVSYGSIRLNWIAPVDNYGAVYNLYRNNTLIAEKIDSTTYTDKNISAGMLTYTVKAFCRGSQTEGDSIKVVYTGLKTPARELTVLTSNAVNGDVTAVLNWQTPEDYTKVTYNVYRDQERIAEGIHSTHYADRGFITDGEHTWSVAAVYEGAESERINVKAVCSNRCATIQNLNVVYDIPMKEVQMSWNKPGALPEDWLTYSYESSNGIGIEEYGGYEVTVAARFTVEDLKNAGLEGATITELAFVPGESRATYFVRAWIGGNGKTPGDEQFNKRLLGREVAIGEWNNVPLSYPITIEKNKELWIGYIVRYTGGSYAIGCDAGPMVKDRNMISLDGNNWNTLENTIENANFNISVAARIQTANGENAKLSIKDNNIEYHIYRDGELIGTTEKTSFSERELPEDTYHYSITAKHLNGCESDSVSIDFFAGNTCASIEKLIVKTPEADQVHLNWNTAEPFWEPKSVLVEHFDASIPATWTVKDKDGDGRSWRPSDSAHVLAECTPYMGTGCVYSEVYKYNPDYSADLLAPDNWLITPPIELTSGRAVLNYHVANIIMQSELTYYEVLISTEGMDYDKFKVIDSDTLMRTSAFVYHDKMVDLSGYTGTVHIAFRHLNDSIYNTLGLQLDEVEVTEYVPVARTYNVYRDDEKIAGPLTDTTYTDTKASSGSHTWCVRTVCNELTYEANPICDEASVTVATDVVAEIANIRVYPNPANHKLTLEKNGGSMNNIKLFDLSGHCLRTWNRLNTSKILIDFTSYRSGVYLLQIDGQLVKVVKE